MGLRSGSLAAASAVTLGTFVATASPAAADTEHTRTDTFGSCQVQSQLTLLDSGSIRVSTTVVGTHNDCEENTAFARVTYVDADGDPQEASAFGRETVTHTFVAPSATDVSSFHSVMYHNCAPEPGACQSPEYRLGSK